MNPAMLSSTLLPGALGLIDQPRKAAFEALGSSDGSGSGLLQALLGIDPNGDVGRYGGLAAEILLDPMNLAGYGLARGAGKLASGIGGAMKAAKTAPLAEELAAARRLGGAAEDAAATVPLRGNPATGLPLGSDANMLYEAAKSPGRKAEGVRNLATYRDPLDPLTAQGGDAARMLDSQQKKLKSGLGDLYDAGMLPDYREGQFRANAFANDRVRAAEWGKTPTGPVSLQEVLGGGGMADVERVAARSPRLASILSPNPSKIDASGVIPQIEQDLAAARRLPGTLGDVVPLPGVNSHPYQDLATVGSTSALTSALASRYLQQPGRR